MLIQIRRSQLGFVTYLLTYPRTLRVRHVLKTLAIFSVHLRQMHYVFHENITRATLQHFTSVTYQLSSLILNNWPLHIRDGYLTTREVYTYIFLGSKYLYYSFLLSINAGPIGRAV